MLVLRDRLINVPVMSLQTGTMIARTDVPIIDPRKLHILAFYCKGPALDSDPAVLHTSDIRETGPMGFIVDSAERIMSPADLVRLQEVIGFHFVLDGKDVEDDSGHKIGKVINYTVDTESFFIIKLHVRPRLWQALQTTEVVIDRRQIREITDSKIIVRAATVRDEPAAATSVENPFRRIRPQPDMANRHES